MKKTLSLLAVLLVLVFAVSCGSSKKDNKDDIDTDTDTTDTENPDDADTSDTSDTEPTGDTDTEEPDTSDSASDDDADTSDTGKPDSDNDDDADSENDDDADSENDDDADTEEEGPLEIIGRYIESSEFLEALHVITETDWTMKSATYGTSIYKISQYSNKNDFIIAQNDASNGYAPEKWSRFDYTEKDGELYFCQTAYEAETEDAALATPAADKTDPATKGCGDYDSPWTKLTKDVVEIIGRYRDNYGMPHVISNTAWSQPTPYYRALFHITQYDSINNVIIAHNDEEIELGNGGKWSRFDYVINGEDIYYCQIAYEEETEEAALAVTTANREDLTGTGCSGRPWSKLIKIVEEPIDKDSTDIIAWATGYENYTVGENVNENWQVPEEALGKAEGTSSTNVVVLGEGGSIVMTFEHPIEDGVGPDFAVFENSFNDGFLELAKVAVSSDGINYVTFDNYYLGLNKVGQYDNNTQKQENIWGFAGKFRAGKGTMFDLADLIDKPEVDEDEVVDLDNIRYVKIIDVIGDGSQFDTMGDPIYDPYPNMQSAGFDLDAIGVINGTKPENEIYGKYNEDGYVPTDLFVFDTKWTMSSEYGVSIFHITQIDKDNDYIIAQNDATYSYNPSLWSRFDYVVAEDGVYYCQIAFDAATKEDAIAATGADRDGLTTTGCNGYPWSKMTAK